MMNTGHTSVSKVSDEPIYDEHGFHIKDRDD